MVMDVRCVSDCMRVYCMRVVCDLKDLAFRFDRFERKNSIKKIFLQVVHDFKFTLHSRLLLRRIANEKSTLNLNQSRDRDMGFVVGIGT